MRPDPRIIAAALLFMASPLRGDSRISTPGPGGSQLFDAGEIAPLNDVQLQAARMTGLANGYRMTEAAGLWHSLALVHDSTLTWPAGARIVATCGNREVEALECFAMSPPLEQRVIQLGHYPVTLNPGEVWRRRFRKGRMATVLFVRFPLDSCRSDISGIRVVMDGGR